MYRQPKPKFLIIDMDPMDIIRGYVKKYQDGICDNESPESYSEQVALDLGMQAAKKWFLTELRNAGGANDRRS